MLYINRFEKVYDFSLHKNEIYRAKYDRRLRVVFGIRFSRRAPAASRPRRHTTPHADPTRGALIAAPRGPSEPRPPPPASMVAVDGHLSTHAMPQRQRQPLMLTQLGGTRAGVPCRLPPGLTSRRGQHRTSRHPTHADNTKTAWTRSGHRRLQSLIYATKVEQRALPPLTVRNHPRRRARP